MADEKIEKPIENLSITDIGNPSIVEILMLQILLRHAKPVVRHMLYTELMQFLLMEKKKVAESIDPKNIRDGAGKFQKYLGSKKKFSSSSLYYSLDNLENKGLVKYNYDKKNKKKVESVEATKHTEIMIDTVLKHLLKFGLLEAQQNRILPGVIEKVLENVLESLNQKKLNTLMYVWFKDYVSIEYTKFLPKIAEHLFLLSKKPVFENAVKLGLKNVQHTALHGNSIRESNDFFDAVIVPFRHKDATINGMTKKLILQEAFRVINKNGVVIVHGFFEIPKIKHGLLNIFATWIKDNYKEIDYYTEEEFKDELVNAGAKEVEIFIKEGYLFGIGRK